MASSMSANSKTSMFRHPIRLEGTRPEPAPLAGPMGSADAPESAISLLQREATLDPVSEYGQELRNAQEALRESEARYQAVTTLSSDWYWEHDEEQRFTRLSEHVQDRTGIKVSTILGKTRWETGIRYDSAERVALEAGLDARQSFCDFQFERDGPDGSVRRLSVSGEPMFDGTGRYIGYRGIGKDITERGRAQAAIEGSQRFARATLDALASHVCVLDASGTILMVNEAWRRFARANGAPGTRYFRVRITLRRAMRPSGMPYSMGPLSRPRSVGSSRVSASGSSTNTRATRPLKHAGSR